MGTRAWELGIHCSSLSTSTSINLSANRDRDLMQLQVPIWVSTVYRLNAGNAWNAVECGESVHKNVAIDSAYDSACDLVLVGELALAIQR